MQETICEVTLEEIRVSPFQPRRNFSEEELEELAESIRSVGLIHPPVVRKVEGSGKILYYELIAGERRWRAAKKAGLKKIPVLVREFSDEEAAKSTLIENVQRVNLDPLETAEAFRRLIEIFRMTQEELAEKVGKKRSTVANYLRLLSLPEPIRASLSSGAITMGHAKAILSLENEEMRLKVNSAIVEKEWTVRQTENACKKLVKRKKSHASSNQARDLDLEEMREKLEERFHTKVSIEASQKGGKVSLHFFGFEDLERLLQEMGLSVDARIHP